MESNSKILDKKQKLALQRKMRREYMKTYIRPEYQPMDANHLTDRQLAERWGVSLSSLAQWRKYDYPKYILHDRRVQYSLSDIIRIERNNINAPQYSSKGKTDAI